MRILFDTNVLLDVLLDRPPHAAEASQLMALVERKRIEGLLGATTVTTVHYLASKTRGAAGSRRLMQTLLSLFAVAPVDGKVLTDALALEFQDYEDAVLHEAARQAGAVGIVTLDPKGFTKAKLRVYSPGELLGLAEAFPSP